MASKIGMNFKSFAEFIEQKIDFLIEANNQIREKESIEASAGINPMPYFFVSGVRHRIRKNDGVPLADYLKKPTKEQFWSKWRYGLPTDLIPSIKYQHRKYISLEHRGKYPQFPTTKNAIKTPVGLTNQNIGLLSTVKYDRYFPFNYVIGTYHPNLDKIQTWDIFKYSWVMVVFFEQFKELEAASGNPEYIYKPIPEAIVQEIINYSVPKIVWDGGSFCEILIQKEGDSCRFNINREIDKIELFSDGGQHQIQLFLKHFGISTRWGLNIQINPSTNLWEKQNLPGIWTYRPSLGLTKYDFNIDYSRLNKKKKEEYKAYLESYKNYFLTLAIMEYDMAQSGIDGLIDPLWYGWGPLPPSLGFDSSKIEVLNDTPQRKIKPSEVVISGKHREYRWSDRSPQQLFGSSNHVIPPSTGGNYSSINLGKHYLVPDN